LHSRGRERMGDIVFPDIGRFSSPSGDLVPGGAEPYLKAGRTRRYGITRRNGLAWPTR